MMCASWWQMLPNERPRLVILVRPTMFKLCILIARSSYTEKSWVTNRIGHAVWRWDHLQRRRHRLMNRSWHQSLWIWHIFYNFTAMWTCQFDLANGCIPCATEAMRALEQSWPPARGPLILPLGLALFHCIFCKGIFPLLWLIASSNSARNFCWCEQLLLACNILS